MKRSIKFDDSNLGMILDIQMVGQDWQRIRPDEARSAGRSDPALRSGPLELSGEMIAGVVRTAGQSSGRGSQVASGSNATPLGPGPA